VDWIGLTQDWYRWRALVNAIMNLMLGNYGVAAQLVASRVVLSSTDLVGILLEESSRMLGSHMSCSLVSHHITGHLMFVLVSTEGVMW
jgi:hypothetical protein